MSDHQIDRTRKIIAVAALLLLLGVIIALSFSDRTAKPMAINGDVLGRDSGEPLEDYIARAEDSLEAAPSDENAFAMVTFPTALGPADASATLEDIGRVNAMILLSAAPISLPEPVAGETREDVFNRHLDRLQRSFEGIGEISAPREINSVLVWDDGAALRDLSTDPAVMSVEVLPPDAGWGHFGVRPVFTLSDVTGGGMASPVLG